MLNISAGFTKSASKALLQAQLCAAAMGSQRMSSGHLLLGLARGGDELTRCIIGDIEVRALEEAVLSRCGHGDAGFTRVTGMTPHVQRILLRAIAYFCGAGAYVAEILILTDGFRRKVPQKELFMAYCFGPLYILLGLSYLLEA